MGISNMESKATTRVGRIISGGRFSEYMCECNGNNATCNKNIFHPIANLIKCRNCKVYMLLSHGGRYWTCGKCRIDDVNLDH